jgi:hypothetical protein
MINFMSQSEVKAEKEQRIAKLKIKKQKLLEELS